MDENIVKDHNLKKALSLIGYLFFMIFFLVLFVIAIVGCYIGGAIVYIVEGITKFLDAHQKHKPIHD